MIDHVRLRVSLAIIAVLVLFAACKNNLQGPVSKEASSNAPSAAISGPVAATVGDMISLDGSASSDDKDSADKLAYVWNVESAPPGSTVTSKTLSHNAPQDAEFQADTGGTYSISLTVTDTDGQSDTATHSVGVKSTGSQGPTVRSFAIERDAEAVYTTNVALDMDVSDDVGVTHMRFSNNGYSWSDWMAYANSIAWEITPGTGTRTVSAEFRDADQNTATAKDSIGIDTLGPTGVLVKINGHPPGWSTGTRSVTLTVTADDAEEICFANEDGAFDAWRPYTTAEIPWMLTDEDGTRVVTARYRDAHGNESEASTTVRLDREPPSINSFNASIFGDVVPSTYIVMESSVSDSTACSMSFKVDNGAWSDWTSYTRTIEWSLPAVDGTHTVYARFRDYFGNTSEVVSDAVTLDTTPPEVTSSSIVINDGADSTPTRLVTLTLSAEDAAWMRFKNDVDPYYSPWVPYQTTYPWTLPKAAEWYEVFVEFKDEVGNRSTTVGDAIRLSVGSIVVDSFTIAGGSTYTRTRNVTLTSGVTGAVEMRFRDAGGAYTAWMPSSSSGYAWNLPDHEGVCDVEAQYRDGPDNVVHATASIILDRAAPPVDMFCVNMGAAATTKTEVTLDIYAPTSTEMSFSNDNATWTAWEGYATTKDWTLPGGNSAAGDGTKTVYGRFRDAAGNVAPASDTIRLDAWKSVRIEAVKVECVIPGDVNWLLGTPEQGEWYWTFEATCSGDGNWHPVDTRARSTPWRCNVGDTLSIGHGYTLSVPNQPGSTISIRGEFNEDDGSLGHTLVDEFSFSFGYPSFGSGTHTEALNRLPLWALGKLTYKIQVSD